MTVAELAEERIADMNTSAVTKARAEVPTETGVNLQAITDVLKSSEGSDLMYLNSNRYAHEPLGRAIELLTKSRHEEDRYCLDVIRKYLD